MKNKPKTVKFQARQGDVLIESTDHIPGQATKAPGRIILAHGEVTGHAHEIDCDDGEAWKLGADTVAVKILRSTAVKHQEHAPIPMDKGTYKITRQREYHPVEIRRVAD